MNSLPEPPLSTTSVVQSASKLLHSGKVPEAEKALRRLLGEKPDEPDALCLLGILLCREKKLDEAAGLLRRALQIRPNAAAWLSLAQALRLKGRTDEALMACRAAGELGSDDAAVLRAQILFDAGRQHDAEQVYRDLLREQPARVAALKGLGTLLVSTARAAEAESTFRRGIAVVTDPVESAELQRRLAAALHKQGRTEEALICYDRFRAARPEGNDIELSRAHLLDVLGRHEEALCTLELVLKNEPQNLLAHRNYNHLLYRLRREDKFLRSYDEAAFRVLQNSQLLLDKAWFLLNAGRFDESNEVYARVLAVQPDNQVAVAGIAVSLEKMGRLEAALHAFRAALARHPDDANLHSSIASVLMKLGEARQAADAAQRGLAASPADQACLAALATAWRLQGDARENWLCRYESFVVVTDIETPAGFSNIEQFNRDVNELFDKYHSTTREFVHQSLRGGTQTSEDIFGAGHRLIDLLQERINEAVARYISELPAELHPFLSRRTADFKYSGSWSSRLNNGGFHANHIHPRGWISSCYYVSLPAIVSERSRKQGWLKFGEPPEICIKEPVRRVVQPREGSLVLFPSYLWHGTVPFTASSARTTIGFDVIPK